jgi:N-acyl-D-amino-acid deacylase
VYRDPGWRSRARAEAKARWQGRWTKLYVKESIVHAELVGGPSIGELATKRGMEPFDLLLDLSLEEDLGTRFEVVAMNDDENEIADLLRDQTTLLGLSDAGAHVRELCDACYATFLLGVWTREREVLTWEDAIWRLTGHPASVFRLPAKGQLRPGFDADVVVFDPATVAAGPSERVTDLPGGADRLVAHSVGIEHVLVNGTPVRLDGKDLESVRPGRVIEPTAR